MTRSVPAVRVGGAGQHEFRSSKLMARKRRPEIDEPRSFRGAQRGSGAGKGMMDDPNRNLREQLERLDADLRQTKSVDQAGRAILIRLQQDVRDLLARSVEPASLQSHPIRSQLLQGIEHFEMTHPALVAAMEQVVNTLSAMGI